MAEGWSYHLIHGGKTLELTEGKSTLGRSRHCDLSVQEPSISRKHVFLTVKMGEIQVQDLGSSNGTFVNDQRITGQATLQNEDHLRLGDAELTVVIRTREDSPSGPGPSPADTYKMPATKPGGSPPEAYGSEDPPPLVPPPSDVASLAPPMARPPASEGLESPAAEATPPDLLETPIPPLPSSGMPEDAAPEQASGRSAPGTPPPPPVEGEPPAEPSPVTDPPPPGRALEAFVPQSRGGELLPALDELEIHPDIPAAEEQPFEDIDLPDDDDDVEITQRISDLDRWAVNPRRRGILGRIGGALRSIVKRK